MREGVYSPSGRSTRIGLGVVLALAFAFLFLGLPPTGHAAASFSSYECTAVNPPTNACQLPCPTETSYTTYSGAPQPVTSYVLTVNQTGGTGTYAAKDTEPTSLENCAVVTSATTWRVAQLCTFHCQHWHAYIQPGGTPFPGSATVTPTPDAGSYFLGWFGGPDSCAPVNPLTGMTRFSCSTLMDMNRTLTAVYGGSPDPTPPTAPVLSSPGTGVFSVQLSWTSATDDIWMGGYELYRNGTLYKRYPSWQNSVTLTNQLCNTHYQFRIESFDGASSTASNTIDATTQKCVVVTTKPPNTQIHFICYKGRTCVGYPSHRTRSHRVLFHWGAARSGKEVTAGVTYQCKLDKRAWTKCRPGFYGKSYTNLRLGWHTFRVKAHDSAGWDPTPAKWTWKIIR